MATDPVEILNRRNTEVAQIRGYVDLTDEAKDRRIAEVSERARAEAAEARETREREIRERAEKAEEALFEIPTPMAPPIWSRRRYAPSGGVPTRASITPSRPIPTWST
jgi:hypothetical protein